MHRRALFVLAIVTLLATACSSASDAVPSDAPEEITYEALTTAIASSGTPSVINSWAAWCPPCRSEAPLFSTAAQLNEDTNFIMLNTKDNPADAAQFIAESFSEAPMIHYADPSGAVTFELGGGRGLPVTFFYDSSGKSVHVHIGIMDEPTLAFYLDEISR